MKQRGHSRHWNAGTETYKTHKPRSAHVIGEEITQWDSSVTTKGWEKRRERQREEYQKNQRQVRTMESVKLDSFGMLQVDWLNEISNITYTALLSNLIIYLSAWALLPKKRSCTYLTGPVPPSSMDTLSLDHTKCYDMSASCALSWLTDHVFLFLFFNLESCKTVAVN